MLVANSTILEARGQQKHEAIARNGAFSAIEWLNLTSGMYAYSPFVWRQSSSRGYQLLAMAVQQWRQG